MRPLALLLLLAATPLAQETHPFSVHDMLAMQRISDPAVSPDGRHVAFTVRDTDLEANRGRTDVWLVALEGGEPRRLTTDPANDWNARWLDARRLVFLSTRGGSSQAWTLAIDGGEAQPLTALPLDVENLEPFPDGRRLLLSLDVWPAAKTLAESVALDEAAAARKTTARVYDGLPFRHWDTWEDGKRSHLFVWEPGAAEPRDLVPGLDADVPTRPFGGFDEVSISPDGRTLAFVARTGGRELAWSTDTQVFLVPADGSAPARVAGGCGPGSDTAPAFSPDGRTLAWLQMPRAGYEADRQQVVLLDLASGSVRRVAEGWDRSAQVVEWAPDGRTLFTTADNVGHTSLFAIDVYTGAVRTLAEQGTCASPQATGGQVVFARDTLKSPVELFAVPAAGGEARALTALNAARVAAARMGDYEQFSFTGAHGDTVHGFVMQPADFEPGRKYPVAFLIHGGPQGSFGDHFHYRWNPQAYAGAGFAAVFIDFHGSTGYGQAFTDAIRGDWGGAPLEDLLKGLDHAVATYPWLDGSRVAALGASYGGYMVNWIAGQAPDRFRCLVSHDGNLDERMAYFDTEELWFPEWEHGGTPWDNPAGYGEHNPIDHVGKWKAPMLVIHGGQDFRVVDTQGMSTFTALQRRGIPSRFVHFPDENHWVLKPANSIEWHRQVLEWITRWTGG